MLMALLWVPSISVADMSSGDAQLRLDFAARFARFATWPSNTQPGSADNPIQLCVTEGDKDLIAAVGVRKTNPLSGPLVLQYRVINTKDRLPDCHILYISGRSGERLSWLAKAQNTPILTVGDGNDFLSMGGHIGLVRNGTFYRFSINYTAAKRNQLPLSSDLLRLAESVQ